MTDPERYAVIAGNGRFPFLMIRAARDQGIDPLVVGIREEAAPELATVAPQVHWVSLGEPAKLLDLLGRERAGRVILAGQVKHAQLFSSIPVDSLAGAALAGIERRSTDALIGAFVRLLEEHGIEVVDSTLFLKPLLAKRGILGEREPDPGEAADLAYGREIASSLAALDIGQTVVVADRACLAVEAMEGTDATIDRAASLASGQRLAVVKVSKPRQDMRFDVPVIGLKTIRVMQRANARALSVDAGKTLIFEHDLAISAANRAGIALVGVEPAA